MSASAIERLQEIRLRLTSISSYAENVVPDNLHSLQRFHHEVGETSTALVGALDQAIRKLREEAGR